MVGFLAGNTGGAPGLPERRRDLLEISVVLRRGERGPAGAREYAREREAEGSSGLFA